MLSNWKLRTKKPLRVGDHIESAYGKGKIIALTMQWIIHDNSLEDKSDEFALLIKEDQYKIIRQDS